MAWMRLDSTVRTHRKVRKLAREIGRRPHEALGHVVMLWTWALENAPDGVLEDDRRDLEEFMGWRGTPGKLIAGMLSAGILDGGPTGLLLHDWMEYQGSRKEAARRQRNRRLKKMGTSKVVSRDCPGPQDRTGQDGKKPPYPPGFARVWCEYPHVQTRRRKAKALQVWKRLKLEPIAAEVSAWIEALRSGHEWTKDNGQFVPAMDVWLKGPDFSEPPPMDKATERIVMPFKNRRLEPHERIG